MPRTRGDGLTISVRYAEKESDFFDNGSYDGNPS